MSIWLAFLGILCVTELLKPRPQISSREDVMRYMNETLMNSAFPWTDISGNELPWRQRLFASDGVSFRVGPVRVRQVRMPHRE